MANFKNRHAKGKPQLRKNSSDWRYPLVERGTYNQGHASTKRRIESFIAKVKDYFG